MPKITFQKKTLGHCQYSWQKLIFFPDTPQPTGWLECNSFIQLNVDIYISDNFFKKIVSQQKEEGCKIKLFLMDTLKVELEQIKSKLQPLGQFEVASAAELVPLKNASLGQTCVGSSSTFSGESAAAADFAKNPESRESRDFNYNKSKNCFECGITLPNVDSGKYECPVVVDDQPRIRKGYKEAIIFNLHICCEDKDHKSEVSDFEGFSAQMIPLIQHFFQAIPQEIGEARLLHLETYQAHMDKWILNPGYKALVKDKQGEIYLTQQTAIPRICSICG